MQTIEERLSKVRTVLAEKPGQFPEELLFPIIVGDPHLENIIRNVARYTDWHTKEGHLIRGDIILPDQIPTHDTSLNFILGLFAIHIKGIDSGPYKEIATTQHTVSPGSAEDVARQKEDNRQKDFQTIYNLIALIGKQNQKRILESFVIYLEEQLNTALVVN